MWANAVSFTDTDTDNLQEFVSITVPILYSQGHFILPTFLQAICCTPSSIRMETTLLLPECITCLLAADDIMPVRGSGSNRRAPQQNQPIKHF